MKWITFIYGVIKAIPILDKWADLFTNYYVMKAIENLKEEDWAAIRKAIDEQDQRNLEKQIGNKKPGEPSNLPGVDLRDTLPGVGVVPNSDKT
jgi:hypothetical protein